MPGRIGVFERIIPRIRIAIEILRICRIRHKRIRGDKPAEDGVIVSGFIEIEIAAESELLARELVGHIDRKVVKL